MRKTIEIVVPCYNEEECIPLFFIRIKEVFSKLLIDYNFKILFGTLEKLEKYRKTCDISIRVYENPLRTAEAGKAVGVRKAQGDIVCLLDSDNIIPDKGWMTRMMKPFKNLLL